MIGFTCSGKDPLFEACETLLPDEPWKTKAQTRASGVTVAAIILDGLPAFINDRFACLEEPTPLTDFRFGLTVPELTDAFGDHRQTWLMEYLAWHEQRILSLLNWLEDYSPDVLVFPRFSVPFQLVPAIADWCQRCKCNAVLGGHSLLRTAEASTVYDGLQNLSPSDFSKVDKPDAIIDLTIRHGRTGRAILSTMESPYSVREKLASAVHSFDILVDDGWLTIATLGSSDAVEEFAKGGSRTPELVVLAAGIHADAVFDKCASTDVLAHIPLVLCGPPSRQSRACVVGDNTAGVSSRAGWEGVFLSRASYERVAGGGWKAQVEWTAQVPIVYHSTKAPVERKSRVKLAPEVTGLAASVADARRIHDGDSTTERADQDTVVLLGQDPDSFFLKRTVQADILVRDLLRTLTGSEVALLGRTLTALAEQRRERESNATLSQAVLEQPVAQAPGIRQSILVDRAAQRSQIARFVESASSHRILLLHGQAGIGKRAILSDVQRTDPDRDRWLRFRCTPDTDFAELLAHLLTRLGDSTPVRPTLERGLYSRVCEKTNQQGYKVVVLEEAHNLPIRSEQHDHADFLAFLSVACGSVLKPPPRFLLVSDLRGHLQFSGMHLMDVLSIDSLPVPDTVQLLNELAVLRPSRFPRPTTDEFEELAGRIHGHPLLAEIAAGILEDSPVEEVLESLHRHKSIRYFVLSRLLGRTAIGSAEHSFLSLASVFRIPVALSAFNAVSGAQSRAIATDLIARFLLTQVGKQIKLHPLIADHFRSQVSSEDQKDMHQKAYDYFERTNWQRTLTLDEKVERIYHAVRCGAKTDFADLATLKGPILSAMLEALQEHDWVGVANASELILGIFPDDAVAKIAYALSLDSTGRHMEAAKYSDSFVGIERRFLWIALEFARSKIRCRDLAAAERVLEELQAQFGNEPSIATTMARLMEVQGDTSRAVEICENVLKNPNCKQRDAFYTGLVLRHLNQLGILVKHVESRWKDDIENIGLLRLVAYASVITDYAPDDGLQTLHQLWASQRTDGHALADYASALAHVGRHRDAEQLFVSGLECYENIRHSRIAILEEYAHYLDLKEQYSLAHDKYRELLRQRAYDLHIYRRFASSLLKAACVAKVEGSMGKEDACVHEAEQVLRKLLDIAPTDEWATGALHKAQLRVY